MICLLNGHSLTAKQKFMPEKLSLQLSERTSTATMTLNADTAPSMNVGDWLRAEEGPGAGIIWRIRSMDNQVDKKTITVTMEHLINSLKDRIIFGEVKTEAISGGSRATAAQTIQFILGHQSDWVLAECGFNVSQPYSFNGEDLLSALNSVCGTLQDCIWQYGFTTYPFKLYVRKAGSEVITEMRTDRNIRTLKKTIDRSRMYTRFYPVGKENLHIAGDFVSKNEDKYGTVCKTETDQSLETEEALRIWANERLNRHCEPAVTVTISGMDLYKTTGELMDSFTIGKLCRVPLPEFNTTILERVTKLSYPDIISDPMNVTVTLANELPDVASIIKQQQQQAAGGGRAAAKQAGEDHAWFIDTDKKVGMVAEAVAGPGAAKDWSRVASVIVDGQGIHQRVTYTEEGVAKHEAEIEVQDHFIRQTVKAIGKDGNVTAASICLAISKAGSSATITADHILLSGNTRINQVMEVTSGRVHIKSPLRVTGDVMASSLTLRSGGSGVTIDDTLMEGMIKKAEVNDGVLTLTPVRGEPINFRKATAITQSWVSGSKSVKAAASGAVDQYFGVDFRFMSGPGVYFIELFGGVGGASNSLAGTSRNIQLGRNSNTVEIQDGNGNKIANTPTYVIPAASWSYGNLSESNSQPSGAAKSYSIDTRYTYHYFDITVGGETKRISIRS